MTALFEIELRCALGRFALDVACASDGPTLGVFGRSGAGKTSLLEAIAGWVPQARGRVAVGGRVLQDSARGVSVPLHERRIGYVPQDLLLLGDRTVRDNVLFGPRADASVFERAVETLELAPLLERSCRALSGGEKQRVALARALCSRPSALLLDEPLASLDLELRRRILPYLVSVQREFHLPTLFVSHDATEVQALCDEVVLLEDGRAVDQGPPAEVLRRRRTHEPLPDNVAQGTVRSLRGDLALVEIAPGVPVLVRGAGLAVGDRAILALAADDLIVSVGEPVGLSARNALRGVIAGVRRDPDACSAEIRCGPEGEQATFVAALTPSAIDELELAPGRSVHLVFKTSACRVVAGGPSSGPVTPQAPKR